MFLLLEEILFSSLFFLTPCVGVKHKDFLTCGVIATSFILLEKYSFSFSMYFFILYFDGTNAAQVCLTTPPDKRRFGSLTLSDLFDITC